MKLLTLLLCSATGIFILNSANQLNAGSVPKQLHNKTVSVSWGEASRNKRISDGATVSGHGKFDRIIYISSAGRFFPAEILVAAAVVDETNKDQRKVQKGFRSKGIH